MFKAIRNKNRLPDTVEAGSRGIVFPATGKLYTDLARRAARTIRMVMPDVKIDLFTDQEIDDPVFDKIHALSESTHRPKIEAIRRTRFERSIVMDTDVIVIADISDMFEVLDRYDMAAALGVTKTPKMTPRDGKTPICLNPTNTGVMAVKASRKVQKFMETWEQEFQAKDNFRDQPAFRRMLYQSDLDFVTLGPAYNCIWLDLLDIWRPSMGAPRVLHVRTLHSDHPGDPETPFDLVEAIGEPRARHVKNLLAADWMLGGDPTQAITKTPNDIRKEKLRQIDAPAEHASETRKIAGKHPNGQALKGPGNGKPGKQVKRLRQEMNAVKSQIYRTAILALAHQKRPIRVCVVGANDGKNGDPIYDLIKTRLHTKTDITLFEPQEYLIPILEANYSFHPSHQIVNAAVGNEDTLTLHAVRPEYWDRFKTPYSANWPSYRAPTGITSFDRESVLRWVQKHLPNEQNPEKFIAELTVPSKRLTSFLKDLGKEPIIDVLQVDAEGFDDEVIYACDIHLTQPKIILFEKSNLSEERLTRLRKHLSKKYDLMDVQRDILAIRRP
ncbi:MAG: hypothetical protein GYB25_14370 [Rhodobacteraceae bacterium]|nr:hypothetical protein [Paracoccaceae bacterium]